MGKRALVMFALLLSIQCLGRDEYDFYLLEAKDAKVILERQRGLNIFDNKECLEKAILSGHFSASTYFFIKYNKIGIRVTHSHAFCSPTTPNATEIFISGLFKDDLTFEGKVGIADPWPDKPRELDRVYVLRSRETSKYVILAVMVTYKC